MQVFSVVYCTVFNGPFKFRLTTPDPVTLLPSNTTLAESTTLDSVPGVARLLNADFYYNSPVPILEADTLVGAPGRPLSTPMHLVHCNLLCVAPGLGTIQLRTLPASPHMQYGLEMSSDADGQWYWASDTTFPVLSPGWQYVGYANTSGASELPPAAPALGALLMAGAPAALSYGHPPSPAPLEPGSPSASPGVLCAAPLRMAHPVARASVRLLPTWHPCVRRHRLPAICARPTALPVCRAGRVSVMQSDGINDLGPVHCCAAQGGH